MSRMTFANGAFAPMHTALIDVEDRGLQFADSVYEVFAIAGGHILDAEPHFDRLERSLSELKIRDPMSRAAWRLKINEAVRRNRVRDGLIYLQVSRGVWKRDHPFPPAHVAPGVIITVRRVDRDAMDKRAAVGVAVVTVPENRWGRCDIKSTALLPNLLAKQSAREAGAWEAWFVDSDGLVTEGSTTSAWIVDRDGHLVTRSLEANILPGVTRLAVLKLAEDRQMKVIERAFTPEEAKGAREAFMTSAGTYVLPIISLDGTPIGGGKPGPVAQLLREAYLSAQT